MAALIRAFRGTQLLPGCAAKQPNGRVSWLPSAMPFAGKLLPSGVPSEKEPRGSRESELPFGCASTLVEAPKVRTEARRVLGEATRWARIAAALERALRKELLSAAAHG